MCTVSPERAVEIVTAHSGPSPRGISCYFVSLSTDWGVKVYRDEEERDLAYKKQGIAYAADIAPAVGECFSLGDKYCYITEQVKTVVEEHTTDEEDKDTWAADTLNDFDARCAMLDEEQPLLRSKVLNLCNEYNKLFTEHYWDIHYGNFGWRRDGKLVIIDFGS